MAVSAFTVANIKPSLGIDANQRFIFGLEEAPEPLGSFKLDNNFTPIIGTPSQTNAEVRNKAFSGYRWIHTTTSTDTYGTYKLQRFLTASPTGVDIMTFNDDGTFIIPGIHDAKYIIQTANAALPNAQSLGALTTGLLKNTVGGITGVLSTSTPGVDYYAPNFPTRLIDDFTDNIDPLAAYGNLGVGLKALDSLTLESPTNTLNVAIGPEALYSFTTGAGNTTVGALAGVKLVTATGNTITGVSLVNLTAGDHNTISGYAIGNTLTTANRNCFFGSQIAQGILGITSLEDCCFIGFQAGTAVSGIIESIAIGTGSHVSGNSSMSIGVMSESTVDSICIGWHSHAENESVVIGNEAANANQRSVAVGHTAGTNGAYGVSVGWSSEAFGAQATAIGESAEGGGVDSVSVGSQSSALGNESIAIGKLSKANDSTGTGAVALGKGARADANNAIAIGKDVIVTTANSMALGNAVNVGIGTFAPAYRLDVFPTGGITFNANAGRIIGVATPSAGTDAANKAYVDSSGVAIANAQFIIRVSDPDLPNAQILGSLATGIVKNTTTTGVLSIAVAGTDYYSLNNPTKLVDTGGSTNNVAMGKTALSNVILSGTQNHVFGNGGALINTGSFNIIVGSTANLLTSGSSNIIIGGLAGEGMGVANDNVLIGDLCARNITGSSKNVFIGTEAGRGLQSGSGSNIGIGYRAGYSASFSSALMTSCVFLGDTAQPGGADLSNAIAIGAGAVVSLNNSMVLGNGVNVGIGTSSPSQAKLVVSGGVTNVASEFSVIRATGNNNATKIEIERSGGSGKLYELRSDDAGAYSIFDRTAAASRMFINTSGNIGINMTSSILAKFHVTGGVQNIASEDTCIRATSSSNSAKIELQCTNGSGKLYEIHSANSGGLHIYDRTGNASRMFINTSGLVGINTFTATNAQLTVSGGVQNITNEESIIRAVGSTNVSKIELQCTNGSGRLYEFRSANDGALSIVDRTGSAVRFFINTSGQIGIGGLTTPHAPLQFPNVVTNRQLVLYEAGNNNFQFHGFGSISGGLGYNVNDVGDSHVFYAGVNTTTRNEVARFTGTGDCVIADTFYGKRPSGTCYMQANATATAVTAGTWTKVAGTTSSGSLNKFTMPADNRLQYTDTRTVTAFVIASVTASHNVALGSLIGFSIFKNGVQVVPSAMFNQDPISTSRNATCITLVSLATNDYIEVFCNSSANANITVSHLTIDVTTT